MNFSKTLCISVILLIQVVSSSCCFSQSVDTAKLSVNSAKAAIDKFDSQNSELIAAREAAVAKLAEKLQADSKELRDDLILKLKEIMDEQTKLANLDGSLEIRNAIEFFESTKFQPNSDPRAELLLKINLLKLELIVAESDLNELDIANSARIKVLSGIKRVGSLKNGELAFSNRKYTWKSIPLNIAFSKVTILEGGGKSPIEIKVTRDGWLAIATATQESEALDFLEKNGWERTEALFTHTGNDGKTQMYICRKHVEKGRLTIPRTSFSGPVILMP